MKSEILPQTGELAPSNKPYQLIRDAISDLELQEEDPNVVVDMGYWHTRRRKEGSQSEWVCYQCFAGAVMSRRLGADMWRNYACEDFPPEAERALHFLDNMQGDAVRYAWLCLREEAMPDDLEELLLDSVGEYWESYCDSPEIFKDRMLAYADVFEKYLKNEK